MPVSMWVSNTATTAMMMPIALGVLWALHPKRGSSDQLSDTDLRSWPFATTFVLMVAYAASVAGIATPVGSPPNLICMAQLRKFAPGEISFFSWMSLMIPIVASMYIVLYLLLRWLQPRRSTELHSAARNWGTTCGVNPARSWAHGRGASQHLPGLWLVVVLWVTPAVLSLCLDKGHPVAKFSRRTCPRRLSHCSPRCSYCLADGNAPPPVHDRLGKRR